MYPEVRTSVRCLREGRGTLTPLLTPSTYLPEKKKRPLYEVSKVILDVGIWKLIY